MRAYGLKHGLAAAALVALACALFAGGCSNQGEGQRCSTQNGNDDCQNGLACVSGAVFNDNFDRCCPPDPTQVTTTACTPTPSLPSGDSGADTSVADTSVADTSVVDTSVVDTSVADSSKDAPADAPDGG